MSKQSLLFCASEVYPFAKTGGLADVAHSLPRVLQENYDVQVVLPLYSSIDREKFSILALQNSFVIDMNGIKYDIELFRSTYGCGIYIYLLHPTL